MKEVNVKNFAVKLKISKQRPAAETFRDETRRHFEHLKDVTSKEIELSELFKHDDRVVLVKGVAGIGKSVLTKQLAFLWANNKIYTQFKLCIIMECREINRFAANEGKDLEKKEQLIECIKTIFSFDLKGGAATLFILDGLDELIDLGESDSVVWQLIDVKNPKYAKAKFILTGRPHIEGKLERQDRDIGGLQKYEIQGLNDKQIQDYINKFTSCEDDVVTINKALDSSKEYIKIISVPQFLNSLCCVSILSGGKALKNAAELYAWVLYLLLKEHVEKQGQCEKLASEIFGEYLSELKVLCEVCYDLLNKNKIIFEGDVKSRLFGSDKGTEFLEGLFADISDNRAKKYQFKHLTLMEFLSAVHVCRQEDRMKIIKDNLKKEFYEVVVFSCQLIGGCKYDGMIKDMFIHDEQVRAIDVEKVLPCVLNLLGHNKQQHEQLFELSIDIIVCFINREVATKKFIITTFKILRWEMSFLDKASMRKVGEICERLIKEFKCNVEDLKETFENLRVRYVDVGDVKSLTCVKYLRNVERIDLHEMKTNVRLIQNEVNAVAKCEKVRVYDCELADDEIDNMGKENHGLHLLQIVRCKLNKINFINLYKWVLASPVNRLELWGLKTIMPSWWNSLAAAIAVEKNNKMLELGTLDIHHCTYEMSKGVQQRIAQCDVDLIIDDRIIVNHPSDSIQRSRSTLSSIERYATKELILPSTSTSTLIERYAPKELTFRRAALKCDPKTERSKVISLRPAEFAKFKPVPLSTSEVILETQTSISSPSIISKPLAFPNLFVGQQDNARKRSHSVETDPPPSSTIKGHCTICQEEGESSTEDEDEDDSQSPAIRSEVRYISEKGATMELYITGITLKVPKSALAVDTMVKLSIHDPSTAPTIQTDIGEAILGNIIKVGPAKLKLNVPALLSIPYSIVDIPRHTSICISYFDEDTNKLQRLPVIPGISEVKKCSGYIDKPGLYALCLLLDIESHVISQSSIKISPFGIETGVQVTFDENTFQNDQTTVDFKINTFTERMCEDFESAGIKPIAILHVNVRSNCQPLKPVRISFPLPVDLLQEKEVLILQSDTGDRFEDVTRKIELDLSKNQLLLRVSHFSMYAYFKKVRRVLNIDNLTRFWRKRHEVYVCVYKAKQNGLSFRIGCCKIESRGEMDKKMEIAEFNVVSYFTTRMLHETKLLFEISGLYTIDDYVEVRFLEFKDNTIELTDSLEFDPTVSTGCTRTVSFFVDGSVIQLALSLTDNGNSDCGTLQRSPSNDDDFEDGMGFEISDDDFQEGAMPSGLNDDQEEAPVQEPTISDMRKDPFIMEDLDREFNRSGFGTVKDLSLRFRLCYKKRCRVLKSAVPCLRFFKDLFKERGKLSLKDIKNDIERTCKPSNMMVFKKIEKDIWKKSAPVSLESKLFDLKSNREAIIYIKNNIAYNLVPEEGTLLPDWVKVGKCHGYDLSELEGLCKQSQIGETAIQRLLSLISAEEKLLPISCLITKLKEIKRNDLVLIVEKWRDKQMGKEENTKDPGKNGGKCDDTASAIDEKQGKSQLKDDFNRREDFCRKLGHSSDVDIKSLCTKFELSNQQCAYIMTEMLPCYAFFESLSISQPELSLQCLRNTIEQKCKHPNKAIFTKIEEDIRLKSISYHLLAELGALIDNPEHWLHVLTNLASNLLQHTTAALPSWQNVASYHRYTQDYIATFESKNKVASSKAERFLSVLLAHNPLCTESDLAKSLQEIERKDLSIEMKDEPK